MKEFNILSLGAGVQSTMLALLSHTLEAEKYVPRFDAAIFSDTQEEPKEVYDHLSWLMKEIEPSYPVLIRTAGKLGDDLMFGKGPSSRFASIPAFISDTPGMPQGIVRRQCSREYKVEVIEKTIKRDILGLKPKQRVPKDVIVHHYIGLSFDEGPRIHGKNGKPGVKNRIESVFWQRAHFPLSDMFLSRPTIKKWLKPRVPHEVPRSACSFCPYRSDESWLHIKTTDPIAWARSIEVDEALRQDAYSCKGLDKKLYLHRSCLPLKDVDLKLKDESAQQFELNFSALECEGMCGL